MITVLVADDHPVVRSGVRNLLRDDSGMRVAAEAQTAAEVLQQVRKRKFDVVLLDISLPDGSGIDLIERVRAHAPSTQIVMFTNAEQEVRRCLDAGAVAFVSKDALGEDLKLAIESAAAGRRFVSSRAARHLAPGPGVQSGSDDDRQVRAYENLSARELEIMLKLIAGRRNKEIGFELGISEKTVATHRARMLKKLGLTDMRSLMLFAMRNGLTDWSAVEHADER